MIYLLSIFITIVMAFIYSNSKIEKSKFLTRNKIRKFIIFVIMITPVILVSGLRYGISVDYDKIYVREFNLISNSVLLSDFEIGFAYFVKLCSVVVKNPWFMFFIVSFLTITIYFVSFKYSPSFFKSCLLFFATGIYFDTFNGIRQYIVCAIFLYCFRFIKNNDWKRYFIIMGLCSFIHISAIFTLPLYFLKNIKFNKIYCFIILLCILLFHNHIYSLFLWVLVRIPKYNNYILRNTLASQISFSSSGFIMAMLGIIPCFIVEREMVVTKEGRFLYNIMLLGFIMASSSFFLPFVERILYYTKTYIILAIPYSCAIIKKHSKNSLLEFILIIMIASMNIIGMILFNWYGVLPYRSIFSV